MIKKTTIPKFIRLNVDKSVLDSIQLALYVTVCKLLEPELKRIRQRNKN